MFATDAASERYATSYLPIRKGRCRVSLYQAAEVSVGAKTILLSNSKIS